MGKRVIVTYIDQALLIAQNAIASDFREVVRPSEVQKDQVVDYAVVDSLELMEKVTEEFKSKQLPIPRFIFVGRNYKLQEYFDLGGTILVDPFIFGDDLASRLIKRSMEISPALHLQEIFKDYFAKYYSYKILNIYRLGYYGDIICKDAVDQKTNFVAIRTFFDHIMLYFSYLTEMELTRFPCEVEYTFKNNQFVMLLHVPTTNNLKHNHLIEGFGEENVKNPISSLLKTCYKSTDYLDVIHNPKTKRLTVIGLWMMEEKRTQLSQSTVNVDTVGETERKAHVDTLENQSKEFNYDYNHHISDKEFQKLEKGERPELPGIQKAVEEIEDDSVLSQQEGVLEELTSFVQEKVELKNLEIDDPKQQIRMEDLSIEEVKKILKDHPEQELVQKLSHKDEKVLTTVISSGKGADELVQMITGNKRKENENVMMKIGSGAKKIADQINLSRAMFNSDEKKEEITFIKSFKDKINQEEIDIIKSGLIPMDEGKDVSIITGSSITLGDEEVEIPLEVKNVIDNTWKTKKSEILEIIQNSDFTEEQASEYIQNEISKVIETSLKTNVGSDFKKVQGQKISKVDEDVRVAMGNVEKELVTKFKSMPHDIDSKEQANIIVDTVIQEAKKSKTVLSGQKKVEEVVSEIIDGMDIPEEEKVAFTKKLKIDDENDVTVVTGSNEFPEGEGYSVADKRMRNKNQEKKKLQKKSLIRGEKTEDEEIQHIDGDEQEEAHVEKIDGSSIKEVDNYKLKNLNGKKKQNTDYKISSNDKSKDSGDSTDYKANNTTSESNRDNIGDYKVAEGNDSSKNAFSDGYKVADNSHLVEKINELEEKLKAEREKSREEAKNHLQSIQKVRESEISDRKFTNEDSEALANEVRNSTVIPEFHKAKMLEVIEHEKKVNEKMAEMSESYHKAKVALDTMENKYVSQIEELERENRSKEHQVDQIKTKMKNMEKDHQIELKRATFEAKHLPSGTKSGTSPEVERYKQKAAALEREKNSLKAMIEDLKKKKIKEKVKVVETEAKSSPKFAELEAQKKRVEVRLSSAETEIKELKKTLNFKDKNAQTLGEQRLKLENDAAKWKKDALTKQSELDKVNKEKTQLENESKDLKKKVEELLKNAKEVKKVDAQVQQAALDTKAAATNSKQADDKINAMKEEFLKEKAQLNKEVGKEKELHEEAKRNYLNESNKVKALEVKAKELSDKIKELDDVIKAHDQAASEAEAKANNAKAAITAKDLSAVTTKNRLLEDTNKKITKDFNETKTKLEESRKEIAILTKKSNETQFKLQEKEKLAEKLQNELKEIKDKEAEAKKKEAAAKKAA